MRKISLSELESICNQYEYKWFSVTNEDSTSFDFTIFFQSIEFYYNTITLRNDAYYLRVRDVVSVSVDNTDLNDSIRFIVDCEEFLPNHSVKTFVVSALR